MPIKKPSFKDKPSLNGISELVNHLIDVSPKLLHEEKGPGFTSYRILRKSFRGLIFKGNYTTILFKDVKFTDCEFDGISGFYCLFQNCKFKNCTFKNCRFSHTEEWNSIHFENCYFRNVEIEEGAIFTMIFEKCSLTTCSLSGLNPSENIRFYYCTIDDSNFNGLQYYEPDEPVQRDDDYIDLLFEECDISSSYLQSLNFRNSRFVDTVLYKVVFSDCIVENDCFRVTKKLKYESYASMDFQTILQSEEIRDEILSTYFNIKNKVNLKSIIAGMTTQKTFSTVFISYSFKDSVFVKKINDRLKGQGIRTFMWEKDAPGGKPLEEIMTSGIGAHDKLLFIASENSIKSKACQFELTTARKKQEDSWENVFFPITIDDYLFKVKKNNIRPIESAEEYWRNIEEIKRVNALDFSAFNNGDYLETEFENIFQKIVDGLKVEV